MTYAEKLGYASYEITTQAITSGGANKSIVLLTVDLEFQPDVKLAVNVIPISTVNDPFNGANYTILLQIFVAIPSGEMCHLASAEYLFSSSVLTAYLLSYFLTPIISCATHACLQKQALAEQAGYKSSCSSLCWPIRYSPFVLATALEHVK